MESTLIITGIILMICLIGLSWFAGSDAPYVATKNERIKKLLDQLGIKKGKVFYELGSGDGRVVFEAAKMGAVAFGIEQSYLRVLLSRWRAKKLNLNNAHFIHGNIFNVIPARHFEEASILGVKAEIYTNRNWIPDQVRDDITQSDIVFIFLLPKGIAKLEPILKVRLKKNSLVVTQTFHFEHWKPIKKILVTDKTTPNTLLGEGVVEGDFWIYRV